MLTKLTEGEKGHLNRPINFKDVESIINNLPKKKAKGTYGFIGEILFYFAKNT